MPVSRTGLRLDPLDTLFFRDGRPFGAATKASGGLPTPQPLAGALRTALLGQAGFDFQAFARLRKNNPEPAALRQQLETCKAPQHAIDTCFRGPWFALADKENKRIEPLLPVPANVVRHPSDKLWHLNQLQTAALPGWSSSDGLRPLWRNDAPDAKYPGGFLTLTGVERYLRGETLTDADWLEDAKLYGIDNRTGIEIDSSSFTATPGQIYGIRLLALKRAIECGLHCGKEICLYAEMLSPAGNDMPVPHLVPLGGEGRYVTVKQTTAVSWPEHGPADRSLWLLATPAFMPVKASLPHVTPPARLVAAASGQPLAVSGWDIARNGPRPTRFAVPAGSVYFVEGLFSPARQSFCADAEDVAQGWGFALRGAWKDG